MISEQTKIPLKAIIIATMDENYKDVFSKHMSTQAIAEVFIVLLENNTDKIIRTATDKDSSIILQAVYNTCLQLFGHMMKELGISNLNVQDIDNKINLKIGKEAYLLTHLFCEAYL